MGHRFVELVGAGALNVGCSARWLLHARHKEILTDGTSAKAGHELLGDIAVGKGTEALLGLRLIIDSLSSRHDAESRLPHEGHVLRRLERGQRALLGAALLDSKGDRVMYHLVELLLLVVFEEGAALLDDATEAGLLFVEDRGRRQSLHLLLLLLVELSVSHEVLLGRPIIVGAHLRSGRIQQSLVHLGCGEGRMFLVAKVVILLEINTTLAKIFVTSSAVIFDDIAVTTRAIGRIVDSLLRLAKHLRGLCGRDMRSGKVITLGAYAMVIGRRDETAIIHDDIAVSAGAVTLIRRELDVLRALQ